MYGLNVVNGLFQSLCRSMYGPNLVELQLITDSSFDEISIVFTWLGAGGIMGSLTYGILFDRCPPLILFVLSLFGEWYIIYNRPTSKPSLLCVVSGILSIIDLHLSPVFVCCVWCVLYNIPTSKPSLCLVSGILFIIDLLLSPLFVW